MALWADMDEVSEALAATTAFFDPPPLEVVLWAIETSSAIIAGYTGGTWADNAVPDEVRAVCALVSLRILSGQREMETFEEANLRFTERAGFHGLTLIEQLLLNKYRTRWAAI